ncbi:hypothetical protein Vretimale_6775 [Volvox reticuliferus]|uniref:Uncharacterized protein n=1 Tax=Volvox reticuliferus TaxID=1737510 RepID=A0A8J4LMP5_9CHLO|nr:hypothetical protein Vretimale_6775 [Volvox reticuliferus]
MTPPRPRPSKIAIAISSPSSTHPAILRGDSGCGCLTLPAESSASGILPGTTSSPRIKQEPAPASAWVSVSQASSSVCRLISDGELPTKLAAEVGAPGGQVRGRRGSGRPFRAMVVAR